MKRLTSIFTLLVLMLGLSMNAKAQTWDFADISEEDLVLLNADTENWTHDTASKNDRWKNAKAIENAAALTANGQELEFTKGLKFTATAEDQIRLDNKKGSLTLNNKLATVTISGVTAGQVIKIDCQSSSSSTARKITATNVETKSGFEESTSRTTNVGTIKEDGTVVLQSTGGLYVYNITVGDAEDEDGDTDDGGDTPSPQQPDDHSTFANAANNQVILTLENGKRYYNTKDVSSINFEDNNVVKVLTGQNTDTYEGTITGISFQKATEKGNEGTISNADGVVKITEGRGWFESAFVKFEPYTGAKTYNVYVKGGQYTEYTKIDEQLVRDYKTYARADVLGLKAASDYAIKVVPVGEDGNEITSAANEATDLAVVNYDRTGFAHKGRTEGVGAYNNDGTLKTGAHVVYVTKNNAKTVSLDVATNAKGGTATYTGLQQIIYGYQKGDANGSFEKNALDIRIIGTISAEDCDKFLSSAEGIQIKGSKAYQPMNITIEGVGEDATTTGFGFLIRSAASIELRNFANMLCMDDAVSIDTDNSNIWVHNLDLFYGKPGSDSDQAKGDGTIDMKGDSKNITISYNHLWDSGKASLCGMKSETGPNWITYHHNWFDHSDSRHPRIRTMSVHVYNNYYDGNSKYGVGAAYKSNAFVEGNYFRNCKYPMLISQQGSDVATNPKGTFSGEDGGMIKSYANKIIGATRYVTYQQNSTEFDAYEAKTRDEQVPETVKAKLGGRGYDNFDTDASLFYTCTPDEADAVPGIVTGWLGAGRMNHGDFQWTFDNATEDKNYDVIAGLKTALQNYKTTLVGIFGDENATSGEQGTEGGDDSGSGDSGDDSGNDDGGVTPTPVEGTILCSFSKTGSKDTKAVPSNSSFTVSGSVATGQTPETIDGVEYTTPLKMETDTSISFTTSQKMKMTLYLSDVKKIVIDGTKQTPSSKTYSQELEAGKHTITKGDSVNLWLIKLDPVE